jgi:hypothetical protein
MGRGILKERAMKTAACSGLIKALHAAAHLNCTHMEKSKWQHARSYFPAKAAKRSV